MPSLELLAHGGRSSGEEEDDGDEEQVARTFSSIDESLEQDEHVSLLSSCKVHTSLFLAISSESQAFATPISLSIVDTGGVESRSPLEIDHPRRVSLDVQGPLPGVCNQPGSSNYGGGVIWHEARPRLQTIIFNMTLTPIEAVGTQQPEDFNHLTFPIYRCMSVFAQQEGLSTHRRTAGGPGTRRRYARSEDDNNGGGYNESMSPASVDENGSAGRLQGLIPGDGQNTFAAQFFSSHPHSHLSAMAVERSMGSIVDTTSAFWSGIAGSGSVLSPGDVSIKTASSMCVGEERKATGGWGEHEYKESGEENENWEDEDDSTEGWDDKQEEEEDGDEESDQGQRRFGTFDEEEKMSPSAEDKAQARGSAARYLGLGRERRNRAVMLTQ